LRAWPVVNYKDGENPWVTYFKKQVYVKNNCINAVATGMPGSGKSWSLLYLLSQADDTFSTDRIFFRASKMLRWIDKSGLKKGRAFMFDEAGIDATNLNWWDEINKGLNAFFQTGRSDNYIFGMTVPFTSMISKGIRTLMNVHLMAEGWTTQNMTKVRPYVLEYNGEMDKFYKKRLFVRNGADSSYCNMIKLPKATQNIIDEYEKMKKEFKADLYNNVANKLERFEDTTFSLSHKQKEYLDLKAEGYDMDEVCQLIGISERNGYYMEEQIRKKGYELPEDKARRELIDKRKEELQEKEAKCLEN
jgi:hypothetical protein